MTARLLATVLAVIGVVVGVLVLTGGDDPYTARAVFANIDGLRVNSQVEIDGVTVGKVAKLLLNDDGTITANLEIEDGAAPLGRDARAAVRAKNLLGARLVDVDPGDPSQPAPSGMTIPRRRTGTPVNLDDVLAVLDTGTRARLRILINELGGGFLGRGKDFSALLESLPPALDSSQRFINEFAADNRALRALLVDSDRVVGSLAGKRRELGRLVGSAAGALDVTAGRRRQLGATLAAAPPSIRQLRESLAQIETAAPPLSRAADQLARTGAPLSGTLRQLREVRPAALETLEVARRAAPQLTRLTRGARPLVTRLRPTAQTLARTATELDPVSSILDDAAVDTLAVLEGWARATQTRDGASHVFRGEVVVTKDIAESLITRFVKEQPAQQRRRPARRRPNRPPAAPEPRPTVPVPATPPRTSDAPRPLIPSLVDKLSDLVGKVISPGPPEAPKSGEQKSSSLLDLLLGP